MNQASADQFAGSETIGCGRRHCPDALRQQPIPVRWSAGFVIASRKRCSSCTISSMQALAKTGVA
jgi:hypothetical protein